MLNEVQEHGNGSIIELHIILLGRIMALRVVAKFVRVRGRPRAINQLVSKCQQAHSLGADTEGIHLSKSCCSVAPGGLQGKAPHLWRGVQCPPWHSHLPVSAPPPTHPFYHAHAPSCPYLGPQISFPDTGTSFGSSLSAISSGELSPARQNSLRPKSLGLSLGRSHSKGNYLFT